MCFWCWPDRALAHSENLVSRHPPADRGTAAAADNIDSVRRSSRMPLGAFPMKALGENMQRGQQSLVQILPSVETNLALATRAEMWSWKEVENKAWFVWRSLQVSAMGVDRRYHINKGFLHSLCQAARCNNSVDACHIFVRERCSN
jgi:hypothetical protein